jgi:hypothetical protein
VTPGVVLGDIPSDGIVRNVVSDAAGWAWDKVAGGIAEWVLGAVGYFVEGVVDFLTTSSSPDVASVWFSGPESPYASVRAIAAVMLVGFALVGLVQGVLRGDPGAMVGRIAGGLPAAVFAMVATTAVVSKLLALTDALSEAVLAPVGDPALEFLVGFGAGALATSAVLGSGFAVVVIGLVGVVAALAVWAELLVRSALIYLLVALSPLAFAATLWPAARGLCRRLVELLLAVVISKFVICVAIAVGVASLAGTGSAADPAAGMGETAAVDIGTLLVGTVILCLSAFAPFIVLKLLPLAEAAVVAQGVSRSPLRAAQSAAHGAYAVDSLSRLAGRHGGGSSGGGSGATKSASPSGGAGGAVAVAAGRAGARRVAGAASSATDAGGGQGSPPTGPSPGAGFKQGQTRPARRPKRRNGFEGKGI